MENGVGQSCYFEEIFPFDISMNVAPGIPFHHLSNAKINFLDWKLILSLFTTIQALSNTQRVALVEKKKFAVAALSLDKKTFVVYI